MAIYRGSQKIGGSGPSINSSTTGCAGQVLKRDQSGYGWHDQSGIVSSVNGTIGDVIINSPNISSDSPSHPKEGTIRYDTNNDLLKSYDGSEWEGVGLSTVDSSSYTQTQYNTLTRNTPSVLTDNRWRIIYK